MDHLDEYSENFQTDFLHSCWLFPPSAPPAPAPSFVRSNMNSTDYSRPSRCSSPDNWRKANFQLGFKQFQLGSQNICGIDNPCLNFTPQTTPFCTSLGGLTFNGEILKVKNLMGAPSNPIPLVKRSSEQFLFLKLDIWKALM